MKPLVLALTVLFLSPVGHAEPAWVDLPEGCWSKKTYPCSFRASEQILSMKRGSLVWSMAAGAAMQFESESRFEVLIGKVWIKETPISEFKVENQIAQITGDVFVERLSPQKIILRNFNGSVVFHSTRLFPSESIPVGFENWYSGIGVDGKLNRGIVIAFELERAFADMRPFLTGARSEQVKTLLEYKKIWADRVEVGAQFYQDVIQRRVAVQEEKKLKQKQQAARENDQNQKLRQMFRQRNNIDQ